MDVSNADLWNLILYVALFVAWAMGFAQGQRR